MKSAIAPHLERHEPLTYLVTGACGFIGTALCLSLLQAGRRVIGIDNFSDYYPLELKYRNLTELNAHPAFQFIYMDLQDQKATHELQGLDFQHVVHLAAQPGVRDSVRMPEVYFNNNVVATYNLLNALFFSPVRSIVFASSSSIYADQNAAPFREDDGHLQPSSPYGVSKLLGEKMFQMAADLGFGVLSMRFFSVYGPRQRPDLLIPKIFQSVLDDTTITLYGNGSSLRDFTYIDDIVQGIRAASCYLQVHPQAQEVLNLGSSKPYSINDLLGICETIMGRKVKVQQVPPNAYENLLTWADSSKVEQLLDFHPVHDLEQGLRAYWEWFQQQLEPVKS